MMVFRDDLLSLRLVRFQKASRLAEGACALTLCRSSLQEDSRRTIRFAAESAFSRGDVDSREHRRGKKAGEREGICAFLRYALNSSSELESHLIFAYGSEVIREKDFRSLVSQTIRVRNMLYALLKRLAVDGPPSPAPARAHKTARTLLPADPPEAPGR